MAEKPALSRRERFTAWAPEARYDAARAFTALLSPHGKGAVVCVNCGRVLEHYVLLYGIRLWCEARWGRLRRAARSRRSRRRRRRRRRRAMRRRNRRVAVYHRRHLVRLRRGRRWRRKRLHGRLRHPVRWTVLSLLPGDQQSEANYVCRACARRLGREGTAAALLYGMRRSPTWRWLMLGVFVMWAQADMLRRVRAPLLPCECQLCRLRGVPGLYMRLGRAWLSGGRVRALVRSLRAIEERNRWLRRSGRIVHR